MWHLATGLIVASKNPVRYVGCPIARLFNIFRELMPRLAAALV
jgi:hypothetical protein